MERWTPPSEITITQDGTRLHFGHGETDWYQFDGRIERVVPFEDKWIVRVAPSNKDLDGIRYDSPGGVFLIRSNENPLCKAKWNCPIVIEQVYQLQ